MDSWLPRNWRERLGLQVDGETVVDLKGYVAPYAGSGVLNLKASTEYTLTMQGASNEAAVYVRSPSDATTGFRSEAGDAIDYYFLYGRFESSGCRIREATGSAPLFPKWLMDSGNAANAIPARTNCWKQPPDSPAQTSGRCHGPGLAILGKVRLERHAFR